MRVVGIDMGTSSVKIVELDTSFGRFEIQDYHETKLQLGERPEQAVGRLYRALPRIPEAVVVALPQGKVTYRNLQLPTRDRKAIQSAIAFELEDELPFQPEESVFDHSVLSQGSDGTHVHIASTLRAQILPLIEALKSEGIDPDVITTETWCMRTLVNRIVDKGVQENPVLVVHMGENHTTLHVQWRGFPVISRRIRWGGRLVTEALAAKVGIPAEEAEIAKINNGFVLASEPRQRATPDQIEFSDTLVDPMRPLFSEIRQVILTCRNLTQQEVRCIYLCGGASLLPGLRSLLEEQNHVPAYPLQALSAASPSGVSYSEETDAHFPMAAALALCVVGQDRAKAINLRRGALSKLGARSQLDFKALKGPLIATGTVSFCLFTSLAVQSSVYQKRMEEVDTQLERNLKAFFGPLSPSAVRTYLSSPERLKKAVRTELEKEREVAVLFGANPRSPLDFLNTLSAKVPKDLVVDMINYQVGAAPGTPYDQAASDEATLTFLVDSKESEERLERVLAASLSALKKIESMAVAGSDPAKPKFKVSFKGTPMESAYGR